MERSGSQEEIIVIKTGPPPPLNYGMFLKMLSMIEAEMHKQVEYYDNVKAFSLSTGTIKEKQKFLDTLSAADAELKMRKYLLAKKREKESNDQKRVHNLEKMALKELVHPDHGKKKMVRENVPLFKKKGKTIKKDEQDPDIIKYFGNDVDLNQIPDEATSESEVEIESEVVDPYDF